MPEKRSQGKDGRNAAGRPVSMKEAHWPGDTSAPDRPGSRSFQDTLFRVSDSLERAKIGEYVDLMSRPKRLIWLNLLGGLSRGAGMAVGFTLIGALVIYVLTRSFLVNLPVVGSFLGELVWIIQQYLKGKS